MKRLRKRRRSQEKKVKRKDNIVVPSIILYIYREGECIMKKVSLLFGVILVGFYLIYGIVTVISNFRNYTILDFIVVFVVLLLVLWVEISLLKQLKKINKKKTFSTVLYENPIEVKFNQSDIPLPNLQMQGSYTEIQLQGDFRILEDSISIMKSTKDIETFISRSDLAMRKALTIEQAGIQSNGPSSKEIIDLKIQLLPNVLNAAYIQMNSEALKLKTVKGQLGRYKKFLKYLVDNEYELDLCDNYEEIVSLTRENISNLQIQLKNS